MRLMLTMRGVVVRLPSPYPLPQAGEGKDSLVLTRSPAIPPLPLAGEGWGEGKLAATPQESIRAQPLSPGALRGSRTAKRENRCARDSECARNPRAVAPRVARHPVRRSVALEGTRNPRCNVPSASVGGSDSHRAVGCARSARGDVRRRWNCCVMRVRLIRVRSCARFPSPYPLPQAGEGKNPRELVAVRVVGNRRS